MNGKINVYDKKTRWRKPILRSIKTIPNSYIQIYIETEKIFRKNVGLSIRSALPKMQVVVTHKKRTWKKRERASERYHHWHWISGRWQQQHSNTNINVWAVSEGEDCIAHVDEQIHSIRRMRTHCTLRYIRATGWLHPVTAFTRLWYAYTYFSLSSTRWRILFISQYASQDSCLWVELGKCLPQLAYCW